MYSTSQFTKLIDCQISYTLSVAKYLLKYTVKYLIASVYKTIVVWYTCSLLLFYTVSSETTLTLQEDTATFPSTTVSNNENEILKRS